MNSVESTQKRMYHRADSCRLMPTCAAEMHLVQVYSGSESVLYDERNRSRDREPGGGDREPSLGVELLNQLDRIQPILIPVANAGGDGDGDARCAIRGTRWRTDQGKAYARGESGVTRHGMARRTTARRPTWALAEKDVG